MPDAPALARLGIEFGQERRVLLGKENGADAIGGGNHHPFVETDDAGHLVDRAGGGVVDARAPVHAAVLDRATRAFGDGVAAAGDDFGALLQVKAGKDIADAQFGIGVVADDPLAR